MSTFSGEQIAQVNNPDPFAVPVWRSPVYHTPGWIITIVQLARLASALVAFARPPPAGHPGRRGAGADVGTDRLARPSRPGRRGSLPVLAAWWWRWRPASFTRFVLGPGAGQVAALALPAALGRGHDHRPLAPVYQGRLLLPVLGKVTSTGVHRPGADRHRVRPVRRTTSPAAPTTWPTGSAPCCAGSGRPGRRGWCWSSSAATPWPRSSPPCRSPAHVDLKALAGRPPRGRLALAGPAARHPSAGRRGHRGREGLDHLGPDPRHALGHQRRAGPAAGRRPQADGTVLRPGDLRPLRHVRRRPRRDRRHARQAEVTDDAGPRRAARRDAARPHAHDRRSRSW